jgi:hypothetical protein
MSSPLGEGRTRPSAWSSACLRFSVLLWGFGLAALLVSPTVQAQDFTAIRGTVIDPSDAAVVGVKIVAREETKGFTHETLSNE